MNVHMYGLSYLEVRILKTLNCVKVTEIYLVRIKCRYFINILW